ncbi:MAG: hypothetical protein JSW45_06975 [Thiotrichales bacterium]|nr:MAG: hypothetical protein JSW45_06975 [Thiotrichales bacterium]
MNRLSFTLLAVLLGPITACSGLKTYHSELDNNLQITSETDSGSVFSSVRAAVDIHTVNPDCSTEYAGTVQLDEQSKDIGIPAGRSSYLVFVFEKSGIFSAETSTSYNTLIRPRHGYRYIAKVSYQENIYNVIINEVDPGNSKRRELENRGMYACRPV